jgi:hypothetical protein
MSDFQICLCGTAPGYPHAADCPRPLYNARDKKSTDAWETDRNLKRGRLAVAQAELLEAAGEVLQAIEEEKQLQARRGESVAVWLGLAGVRLSNAIAALMKERR